MEDEERPSRLRRFVPVRLRPSEPRDKPTRGQRFAQAAAAAAVVICLIGAWGVVRNPFGESPVEVGQSIGPQGQDNDSDGSTGTQISAAQRPGAVPQDFDLVALSPLSTESIYGLGQVACGADRCPALVKSSNGGHSWTHLHTFHRTDTSASNDGTEPEIEPAGALSGVRFVTSRIGYVFGGDLWMTTDGGASFVHVAHPNTTVLDVVASSNSVDVLSAEGCVQGSCAGRLNVSRMSVGSRAPLAQPLVGVTPASSFSAARFAGTDAARLVIAQGAPGSTGDTPGAWRLSRNSLLSLPLRALCHGNALLSAAGVEGRIVGACDATASASTTSYTTLTSSDAGARWTAAGVGNISLPTQGRLTLATNDGQHLVASTGGPRLAADGTNRAASGVAISVSADGGHTWSSPRSVPQGQNGGFDSVIALGGHNVVALPGTGGSYWRSNDDGQTWHKTTVSAPSD